MSDKFDIDAALKEVKEKEIEEIEKETSYKWASRSCACFQLYKETELLKWLLNAEEYANEAIEHGALVKDGGKTLGIVEKEIDKNRPKADKKVESNYDIRKKKIDKLFE